MRLAKEEHSEKAEGSDFSSDSVREELSEVKGVREISYPREPLSFEPAACEPDHRDTDPREPSLVTEEQSLLSEENTAAKGRELLDSLVSLQDWQATFLLSRLYFDPREYDTVFYDKRWGKMRDNYGITPNNKTAHNYLFDAFELKENDFMILYQLGCDYKAGTVRGCDRNLDYALWCFNQAEKHVLNNSRYREELEHGRDRISTDNHSPIKPSR